ncbi:hypothetical protein, partial [Staphylococcus argenteus]|uniref:hypothetical protein n=1 Tax=Staphylococcus argenteus TaxID=985002 RepID=UPI001C52A7E3
LLQAITITIGIKPKTEVMCKHITIDKYIFCLFAIQTRSLQSSSLLTRTSNTSANNVPETA